MERQSIRLKHYDYSKPGGYFVTICIQNREHLLGEIKNAGMKLNQCGKIVYDTWMDLPSRLPHISVDICVVMPNHFHGILMINPFAHATREGVMNHAPTLGMIMRAFKSISAIAINKSMHRIGPVWQRNYHEHIIRDENDLNHIREYIENNPMNWAMDPENPMTVW